MIKKPPAIHDTPEPFWERPEGYHCPICGLKTGCIHPRPAAQVPTAEALPYAEPSQRKRVTLQRLRAGWKDRQLEEAKEVYGNCFKDLRRLLPGYLEEGERLDSVFARVCSELRELRKQKTVGILSGSHALTRDAQRQARPCRTEEATIPCANRAGDGGCDGCARPRLMCLREAPMVPAAGDGEPIDPSTPVTAWGGRVEVGQLWVNRLTDIKRRVGDITADDTTGKQVQVRLDRTDVLDDDWHSFPETVAGWIMITELIELWEQKVEAL